MAENIQIDINANTSGLTSGLDKAKKSINSASYALNDLSRIAQDAPYGFIGISNNINPLVESFGRLRASTGSTAGALKEMVLGLTGPAGAGLAFGLLSAGISFASVGLSRWVQTSKEAKKSTDEVSEAVKQYTNRLAENSREIQFSNDLAEYNLQLSTLDAKAKGASLKELRKIEEEYWTNVRSTAQENLIKTLDDNAAKQKLYTQEHQIMIKSNEALTKAQNDYYEANRRYNIAMAKNRLDDYNDNKKNLEDTLKLEDKYNKARIKFTQSVYKELRTATPLDFEENIDIKLTPVISINNETIRQGLLKNIEGMKLPSVLTDEMGLNSMTMEGLDKFWRQWLEYFQKGKDEAQKEQTKIITELSSNMVNTLAEGIGNAIASGGATVGDAFKGIFSLFGDAIIEFGKKAVLFSKGFLVLKKVLEKGSAVLGIGAGIALIAIGAAIKATAGGGMKFATGTTNAPGGMSLVGERGPELVNLPRGSQVIPNGRTSAMLGGVGGSMEVYGVLRGQDIYFSNKKYAQTYNRTT